MRHHEIIEYVSRTTKKYLVPHEGNNFRPYLLRAVGVTFILVFVIGTFLTSNLYTQVLRTNDFAASVLPAVLADLANADRSSYALSSLTVNSKLQEAAQEKADDMAAKSYFAHTSPEGLTPWHWIAQSGYDFLYAGENLAINFDDSGAINDAWMNSQGHRENILNNHFTEVGIATARGIYEGNETTFVVEMFASPMPTQVAQTEKRAPKSSQTTSPPPAPINTAIVEVPIEQVASSSVLGVSGSQLFVAVKNASSSNIAGTIADANISAPQYASLFEQLVTSPSKVLAIVYVIIAMVLLALFVAVASVRHKQRARHIISIFILLVVIFAAFYIYRLSSISSVTIL